jgi:hypothetical protein
MIGVSFPRLAARDLDGRDVMLPVGLPGERNVVVIAFRRGQQKLVDSWVPWLEQRAAADPRLRFVELPAIGPQPPARRDPQPGPDADGCGPQRFAATVSHYAGLPAAVGTASA